ncbi:hypothetical protein RFI_09833 [Reticulomyxa filosa]|uniref:Kelch motif family protein n=1 Tax=Reticulomyxa filosa TaxID=46433 RepID=X6NMZ0_RETFI|nr:hypothetical protein RFI_09833 [Reticulomyxa filosa]|eukprot:ETO27298.1 hypothetical protein RFI_09833 [Reticulomyxa filosa]
MNDDFHGIRAVIAGSDNHLLFFSYYPSTICVFNLKTCEIVKSETMPVNIVTRSHCFVSKNNSANEILLFCRDVGLSIKYNEKSNTFEYHRLQVATAIRPLFMYAYVYVNDSILFFGGESGYKMNISNKVFKYSITENKWMEYERTLPAPLTDCIAVLNQDNTFVHILGTLNETSALINVKVCEFMDKERQWKFEDEGIIDIENINIELSEMSQNVDIRKLKVFDFFFFFF